MRFLLAVAISVLAIAQAVAAAPPPPKPGDWIVTQNFRATGPNVCQLRFATYPNKPSLTIQNRVANTSQTRAFLVVGGLPPLLAAKTSKTYGVAVQVGGWKAGSQPAIWSHGTADNNSSIAVDTGVPIASLIRNLSSGGKISIDLGLPNAKQPVTFSMAGIGVALPTFKACVQGL